MTAQNLVTKLYAVMETLNDKIARKLNDFINQIIFLEKKNVFRFRGLKLYPSEIHLILVMSEAPTNATQMAGMLGVTKGAVSQTITRLEKKGILKKEKDPYLKNELTLSFTPLGKEVFDRYTEMSRTMDQAFREKISRFSHDELGVIDRFLDHLGELPDQIRQLQESGQGKE